MKHFLLRALNKLGLLAKLNINGKLILNNKTFNIPIIKLNGYNNLFMSEIWMVELLDQLVKNNNDDKKFIDVGVNIGQTLLKLRSVSDQMKYIGFEPNPLCVFYTNELIKANDSLKKSDITLYPVGISTENEVLTLNLYTENEMDSSASIIEEFREHEIKQKFNVPVFNTQTIDSSNDIFNGVGIIKIDVEGAELEVLNSFNKVIERERPYILIEILPIYKEDNTFRLSRQNNIESNFKALNYSIYRIERTPQSTFSHLTKIESIGVHADLNQCDYIIIPNENNKLSHLISKS